MAKLSVQHDSEIILIFWFADQEIFLIINVCDTFETLIPSHSLLQKVQKKCKKLHNIIHVFTGTFDRRNVPPLNKSIIWKRKTLTDPKLLNGNIYIYYLVNLFWFKDVSIFTGKRQSTDLENDVCTVTVRVSTLRFAVYRNLAWFQHLKRVNLSHKWQQENKRVPFKQLHLSIFLSFSSLVSIHHDHEGWEISTEKQTLKRSIIIWQSFNIRLSSAKYRKNVFKKNLKLAWQMRKNKYRFQISLGDNKKNGNGICINL